MPKKQKKEEVLDVEETEKVELSDKVMQQFSESVEKAVLKVLKKNSDQDCRPELVNIMLSVGAATAVDLGLDCDDFADWASHIFLHALEDEYGPLDDDEELDTLDKVENKSATNVKVDKSSLN